MDNKKLIQYLQIRVKFLRNLGDSLNDMSYIHQANECKALLDILLLDDDMSAYVMDQSIENMKKGVEEDV